MSLVNLAKRGDLETIKSLLEADAEAANESDESGVTALMWALYHGHPNVARLIAQYRALSVFEAAAIGDHVRLAKLLTENPGLAHEVSPDGFSALGFAAFLGHLDCVNILIEAGSELNRISTNHFAAAPHHSALASSSIQVFKRLVEAGADVNLQTGGGYTPLHYAADIGDAELTRWLLAKGADPNLKESNNLTPAELAISVGHDEVAEAIAQC